ncbi:hypothetical protein EWM64_g3049 [Hericium alpestre]|uniref:Uncharacterized protein n=1 Tax=Hericium alpestre TaxID=135208 RepID=A0A4Z0A3C2_9AGAM|nr:hypothetical protein EWM64_g3049 [Hericium alpestre]
MCGEQEYRTILASLWTEAVLYGLYFSLFAASVYILVQKNPNRRYLAVTIAMFVFTTGVTLAHFILILLTPINTTTGERHDAVPSAVLLLGTTVCNLAVVGYESRFYVFIREAFYGKASGDVMTQVALHKSAGQFSAAATILSLVLTIVTTSLIAVRIWLMARDIQKTMGRSAGSKYRTAIAIIVESGALYSASLILSFITGFFITVDSTIFAVFLNHTLSIAPTLVIVRVGMGQGFENVQDSAHSSGLQNMVSGSKAGTGTLSALHFRTMQETGSETSSIAEDEYASGNWQKQPAFLGEKEKAADNVGMVV